MPPLHLMRSRTITKRTLTRRLSLYSEIVICEPRQRNPWVTDTVEWCRGGSNAMFADSCRTKPSEFIR